MCLQVSTGISPHQIHIIITHSAHHEADHDAIHMHIKYEFWVFLASQFCQPCSSPGLITSSIQESEAITLYMVTWPRFGTHAVSHVEVIRQ